MKVLIIEDEIYSYNSLRKILLDIDPAMEIDGPVTSIEDLTEILLHQEDYNIIFSDIRLEDGVCFTAFADVRPKVPVIFTTAYDEYALRAFNNNGIGYLLKPIDSNRLKEVMGMFSKMQNPIPNLSVLLQEYGIKSFRKYQSRILIDDIDGSHILEVKSINHIIKDGDKVIARLNDGSNRSLSFYTLDAVEHILDPDMFFRANRQYIININSIESIKTWFRQTQKVVLKHYRNVEIKISKQQTAKFRNWIQR